jgi:uncharacterized protein (DUF427 family)
MNTTPREEPLMRHVTITTRSGEKLAEGSEPDEVFELEGNWYFDPGRVAHEPLHVTQRTYTCPYKGTCNWVDYEGFEGHIRDVAWVYPEAMEGYERIAGRYGFYPDGRAGTYARVRQV